MTLYFGMKKIIVRIFTYIAILFLVDSLIHGFEFVDVAAVLLLSFLLSITDLIINPVVKFFTLPLNLFTFGIFNFVLSCVYLYFFDLLIPGLRIIKGYLGPFTSSAIQIPQINLSQLGVVIIAALMISILNTVVSWTQS
jgi:putative membrane protein